MLLLQTSAVYVRSNVHVQGLQKTILVRRFLALCNQNKPLSRVALVGMFVQKYCHEEKKNPEI